MFYFVFPLVCVEVEPYLIFANRYYLRKLNLDGSNYTLIKQVRHISLSLTETKQIVIIHTPANIAPTSVSGSE